MADITPAANRRVLADTRYVVAWDGDARHSWHAARKHGAPVLAGDRPWDRVGAFVYGTVREDGGRLRLWYQARSAMGGGNSHAIAYAESADGVCWEKPSLGVVDFQGTRENNLTDAVLHLASVGGAPGDYWAAGHVWAGATSYGIDPGYGERGVYLLRSADGFRWRRDGEAPLWDAQETAAGPYGPTSDVDSVIYDPYRGRYLASNKLHVPIDGTHRRAFATRTSPDLRAWSAPRLGLVPDELDDRRARDLGGHRADFYGLTFHLYPQFILGFVWVFYMTAPPAPRWPLRRPLGWGPDGRIAEVQPVFSYDGEYWIRPHGRPALIAAGERGDWDFGNVATANQPVERGDEVLHYYGGGPIWHGAHARPPDGYRPEVGAFTATGLARLQRDRYASWSATTGGSVLLRHGPLAGRRLLVNARAPHGSVRAAVLDAAGQEIAGLGLADCRPFHGDAVAGEITWEGSDLRAVPAGTDACIRFVLQDAGLFAYEIAD